VVLVFRQLTADFQGPLLLFLGRTTSFATSSAIG
jgi:hypothetical protein